MKEYPPPPPLGVLEELCSVLNLQVKVKIYLKDAKWRYCFIPPFSVLQVYFNLHLLGYNEPKNMTGISTSCEEKNFEACPQNWILVVLVDSFQNFP